MRICIHILLSGYFCWTWLSAAPVFAQATELPQGWQTLSAEDFVAAVNQVQASGQVSAETQQAVTKHAATLLTSTNIVATATDYDTLVSLFRWGKSQLTAQQQADLTQQLAARKEQFGSMPYLQLRHKVAAMFLAGASFEERSQQVANWINSDETGFERVWEGDFGWLYNALSYPHLSHGTFSVTWTGTVTAPRTGAYIFSISPINVNANWRSFYIRNNWTVSVAGQQILRATQPSEPPRPLGRKAATGQEEAAPETPKWASEGASIQLVAGQPVELRVDAEFSVSRPPIDALHAMLFWQGPGLTRQIVPTTALKTPNGEPGLLGEYSVVVGGNPQMVTRVDPAIDFAWTTGRRIVPEHRAALEKLTRHIWQRCMDPQFLARCESTAKDEKPQRHPFLDEPFLVECLTSAQRKAFLKEVVARPAMLDPISPEKACAFFVAFRFGAEDEALDAWGMWSDRHADLAADLPGDSSLRGYLYANRVPFHDLARCVTQQYPPHGKRLEEEFLEREDGTCPLPVAYTLAYAYQDRGRIAEWIRKLDDRLSDESLEGDRRVNWLIARAMAEEIRGGHPSFFEGAVESLSAGREWLDEANLVSTKSETKLRLTKERIARHAALRQWDATGAEMQNAPSIAASWQGRISELQRKAAELDSQESAAVRDEYVAELKRRREKAAGRNDTTAENRYTALIDQVEAAAQAEATRN